MNEPIPMSGNYVATPAGTPPVKPPTPPPVVNDSVIQANQDQAAKLGIKIPGVGDRPAKGGAQPGADISKAGQPGYDVFGNKVTSTGTSGGTDNTDTGTPTLSDPEDRKALAQAQADFQTQATNVQNTITSIQNGVTPLTAGETAQIDGLKQQFQALIDQQNLQNTGATGTAQIRGYQTGAAEYDPLFQVKTIGSIVSAGISKIADLSTKEASAVAKLTQSFKDDDIKSVQDAWSLYKDASKARTDALQKTIDDTQKAIKDAQDAKVAADKVEYETVTKPIQDLSLDLAKNNAPKEIRALVSGSKSVNEAIENAGDWLQTATGDLGDYLQYKRTNQATGKSYQDYDTWLAAKKAVDDKREVNKAYATAYASASGKNAADAASGNIVLKPLTEVQAKDLTYAQRGDNAEKIIDALGNKIVNMDPISYTSQKNAEGFDLTNPYVSSDIRNIRQAERDFATAILRRESGAAISPSEFSTVESQYFPRPGDDSTTLAQKANNRSTAINSFKQNVPNYDTRISQTPAGILENTEQLAKDKVSEITNPSAQQTAIRMANDGVPYTQIVQALGI